jgi:hypothetical protein
MFTPLPYLIVFKVGQLPLLKVNAMTRAPRAILTSDNLYVITVKFVPFYLALIIYFAVRGFDSFSYLNYISHGSFFIGFLNGTPINLI